MKIYATIISERASKGQGGNKKLEIVLTIEDENKKKKYFGKITLTRNKDFYWLGFIDRNTNCLNLDYYNLDKLKGKKRKSDGGDKSLKCGCVVNYTGSPSIIYCHEHNRHNPPKS